MLSPVIVMITVTGIPLAPLRSLFHIRLDLDTFGEVRCLGRVPRYGAPVSSRYWPVSPVFPAFLPRTSLRPLFPEVGF